VDVGGHPPLGVVGSTAPPTSMFTDNQRIALFVGMRGLSNNAQRKLCVRNVLIARAVVAARRAARRFAENASARIAIGPPEALAS
jgi:hypothetical protein